MAGAGNSVGLGSEANVRAASGELLKRLTLSAKSSASTCAVITRSLFPMATSQAAEASCRNGGDWVEALEVEGSEPF
jgi:hypothetical protein